MNENDYLRFSRGMARALMALAILLGGVLSAAPPTAQAAPRAAPTALTVTLRADADATVDASAPGANFASASLEAGGQKQIYVKFNLTALPANAVISAARLRLKTLPVLTVASADVSAGRADANWTETTIMWNNKPALTPSGVSTTVNLPGGNWEEWTVTPLVQAWHDGSLANYGFVLAAPDSASAIPFHSKETGPAPQLVIELTAQDGPDDPDRPEDPYPDLGDAPDSSNHHGIANTAYSGVNGRFPTVWEGTPAGQPAGPLHLNRPAQAYLGDHMSREADADTGPDADGPNNILRNAAGAVSDVADKDRGDDGWRNRGVPIPDCRRVTLNVRVHKRPGATETRAYLNIWFDGNRDGDWKDAGVCTNDETGQQFRSYEWLVQDFMVDLTAIPAGGSLDIPVTTLAAYNQTLGEDHWMRFILSDTPAPRNPGGGLSDGRGPHPSAAPATYAWGETEDVLQNPNPPGEPGQLVLRKAVEVNETPVRYAGIVTYKIRLKNDGGSAPVDTEIRDTLSYPQHILGSVQVTEVSPGVSPLSAQVLYKRNPSSPRQLEQEIRWQGTLDPGAEVELAFDVHVHPVCGAGQETKEIVNVAKALKPDGSLLEDEMRFTAACPGYSIGDIEVGQELITGEGDAGMAAAQAGAAEMADAPIFGDAAHAKLRATMTNNAGEPVTVGFRVEIVNVSAGAADAAQTDALRVRFTETATLGADESQSFDFPLNRLEEMVARLLEQIPDSGEQELEFVSRIRYGIMADNDAEFDPDAMDAEMVGEHEFRFRYRPWDLGDAPDSTNHPGAAMTAYPGVPARYPTVFGPATAPGGPQGPAHLRSRPFHLGKRVEFEPDADKGVPPRNIYPVLNVKNRDRHDDGAKPYFWTLEQCKTTTVPVEIFISPRAVTWFQEHGGKAFLNGWIDGNRDGDWEDVVRCPETPDLPGVALEHAIIDAPIDVAALGPGLHIIPVKTGRIPWPAEMEQQRSWVRLTLSERPSNKPFNVDGIDYGDGRGYARPFRTGETEDYILRPEGDSEAGPDAAVSVELIQIAPRPGHEADGPVWHAKVGYGNIGTETARDAKLAISFRPEVDDEVILGVASSPELGIEPTVAALQNIELGDLVPGVRGGVLVTVRSPVSPTQAATISESISETFTVKAVITTSSDDVNPDNNEDSATKTPRWPLRFGFQSPDSPVLARAGTTCSAVLNVEGMGRPGETVVFSDAHKSEVEIPVGGDGRWSTTLDSLEDGRHYLRAKYAGSEYPRARGLVKVDTSMILDPITLTFTDSRGRVFKPSTLGWNSGGFHLHLPAGEVYEVGINTCGEDEYTLIVIDFTGAGVVELTDEDGDGRYTGQLDLTALLRSAAADDEQKMTITVMTNDGETSYQGVMSLEQASSAVKSAESGQAIANATITLLEQQTASEEGDAIYDQWASTGYGQSNPQSSDPQGGYLFAPPAGTYQVYVTADGYQPYRSDDIAVADGELLGQDVTLMPAASRAADVTVEIDDGGFNAGVVMVKPGSVVHWVNMDGVAHQVVGEGGMDSGLLLPGESYMLVFNSEGTFNYGDGQGDLNSAAILVTDRLPSEDQSAIFLPIVVNSTMSH